MDLEVDFSKGENGLIPAIIQDVSSKEVLMLGYMNAQALQKTKESRKVTFYSRSKKRLWTKGEESGNFLDLVAIQLDCDQDTLLVQVRPQGPTCHTGSDTCWGNTNPRTSDFLKELQVVIRDRRSLGQSDSYIASLFNKGTDKIAQKVGEEAVEVVIEAMKDQPALFLEESADLLFHFLILLEAKGHQLDQVIEVLQSRHNKK